MKPLRLVYLYPAEMNIYGDRGNIITLLQRCQWRGLKVQVDEVHLGGSYDFGQADLVFGGGGQDKGQELVAQDLLSRGEAIKREIEAGLPVLVICGLYQLFGRGFITTTGKDLPGIAIFDLETNGSSQRMIGNIVIKSRFGDLVGFENHSGQTLLGQDQGPLGKVIKGFGNDGQSGYEGAMVHNAIGTYLHGPVLPKNPAVADFLISRALERRGLKSDLRPLDDSLELMAATAARDLRQ